MKSIVHGLDAQYADQINFVYLDIDDPQTAELKQTLKFRVQPQFFLLDGDGKIVKQWLGGVKKEDFEQAFQTVLQ